LQAHEVFLDILFLTGLFKVIEGGAAENFDAYRQGIFVYVEAWMVMRILRAFRFVVRTDDEVTARSSIEEVRHIITAGSGNLFAIIDGLLAYSSGSCLVHQFCHGRIIDAGWAAIDDLDMAATTQRGGDTLCGFCDPPQQVGAMFRRESAHRAFHHSRLGDDIEGGPGSDAADSDDGRTER